MLKSGEDVFSELGWVIEDIRELLPLFCSISFCNVPNNLGSASPSSCSASTTTTTNLR